ncbi:uncharacterized protein LOC143219381 [Lasioglossum baleicum]|uniref:uncharacterized protein LOC143219381 n=1 Tax=Lasioglossum baleicum TaxID=434251 RepID=UPI003FCE5522
MTESDVDTRLELLEDYWTRFQENHDLLTYRHKAAIKDSDYVKTDMADAVEEAYLTQKSRLRDLAKVFSKTRDGRTNQSHEDVSGSGSSSIPRMPLPQFSGEYVDWPSFKDRFLSMIDRKKGLTEVDKLHYLKGCLQDQAVDLIKDLPTTNENYTKAWNILMEHYENKRILVRSCLDKLAALPKMRESSVQEMTQIQKGVSTVVNTMEGLGRPIDQTADWFVHSIVNLFDPTTRDKWEESVTVNSDPPSYTTLTNFMIRRLQMMQASPRPSGSDSSQAKFTKSRSGPSFSRAKPTTKTARINHAERKQQQITCVICSKDHYLMHCSTYKESSPEDRKSIVEKHQLCRNCLGNHTTATCPSKRGCFKCGERHHTTIHGAIKDVSTPERTTHHAQDCRNRTGEVLLATAMIHVSDRFGRRQTVRALIDQGSEITMISEGLAQRLQLPRTAATVDIFGVGGQQLAKARGRVTLDISASKRDDPIKVTAVILSRLSTYTHGRAKLNQEWVHLRGLQLADPSPGNEAPIEVLIGADVYPAVIKEGVKRGALNQPVGQLTIFGWIITGMTGTSSSSMHAQVHQTTTGDSLSSLVRRFWEQEDLSDAASPWTADEQECEHHYATTHSRTLEGRYQVRLPFKTHVAITSGSRSAAWHSLRRMELRFSKDKEFKDQYCDFLNQYSQLGHMSLVEGSSNENQTHYLPHHGVLKPSSITTKLRVVFNGSWSEPAQPSLNDTLHVGPNLLPALSDVILRWRKHQYVVTADVTKMYRQIFVHPDDRDVQRILWRHAESQPVREYRLNTVTYGLSCAPYLAVRTLRQLAEDGGSQFPKGALAIKRDAYVDDILTGADTITALKETADQLQQLCMAGGFPLQKWASNVTDLQQVTKEKVEGPSTQSTLLISKEEERKTWTDCTHTALGLHWSPHKDTFQYSITDAEVQPPTKRSIVSKTAQLFDPLGWLTPVIVRSKIAIQSTWLLGLEWDTPLPSGLADDWTSFCAELKLLERVRIPRPLSCSAHPTQREMHGFADASERAYAAVLYLRTKEEDEQWKVTLITAKSKVAPLKQVSLPRLELCAAHLLARLAQKTATTLEFTNTTMHLWSDSTVALGWIQAHPSRWKTYVANRVADIQRRVPEAQWHHVAGVENPADCASRGLSPSQLLHLSLWWTGPEFLQHTEHFAATQPDNHDQLPEERGPTVAAVNKSERNGEDNDILTRFSSYTKLLRVTAWCLRWLRRRRNTSPATTSTNPSSNGHSSALSATEIDEAEKTWIQLVQKTYFKEEMRMLAAGTSVQSRSILSPLSAVISSDNLLRVGGRLRKAHLNPDEAHPIILPPDSLFTELYTVHSHLKTLHGGVQATLGAIRQRFWIPKGRSRVKAAIRRCVTCLRWRAEPGRQLMGQLPEHRVTPARPFHSTGVDYAGPIWLRTSPGRGHKATKAFFAVFICMVTKAVHLEVVSSYSSEAFLAAFRRFISRRGHCAHLYSDCGTNFLGADRELRRLFTASCLENRNIRDEMGNLRTQWHFNPPAAPHFGGLWEAAVKSTKHHLRRTVGEARLTYEEMSTLLSQIEACLNSRPLAALSDDPSDLTALTPGHFLVGTALNALPEPSLVDQEVNRLTRWQLVTHMRDHFWLRWQREYLHGLTTRSKWRRPQENIMPGRLCIISGETTPPSQWPLARVKEVHPGSDGKVRVVKAVTATSEFVRPIHKLIVLPIDANDR